MNKLQSYTDSFLSLSTRSQVILSNIVNTGNSFYTYLGQIKDGSMMTVPQFVSIAQVLSRKIDRGSLRIASGFQFERKNPGRKINTTVAPYTKQKEYTSYAAIASDTNLINMPMKMFTSYLDVRSNPFVFSGEECPAFTRICEMISEKLGRKYVKEALSFGKKNQYEQICYALFLAAQDQKHTTTIIKTMKTAEKTACAVLTTLLVLKALDLKNVEAERICESALQVQYCNILNALGEFGNTVVNAFANAEQMITRLGLTAQDIARKNKKNCYKTNSGLTIESELRAGIDEKRYFIEYLGIEPKQNESETTFDFEAEDRIAGIAGIVATSAAVVEKPLEDFSKTIESELYKSHVQEPETEEVVNEAIKEEDTSEEEELTEAVNETPVVEESVDVEPKEVVKSPVVDETSVVEKTPVVKTQKAQSHIYRKTMQNRIATIIKKELTPTLSVLLDENKTEFYKSTLESFRKLVDGKTVEIDDNDSVYCNAGKNFAIELKTKFMDRLIAGVFGKASTMLIPNPEYSPIREHKTQKTGMLYLLTEGGEQDMRNMVRTKINVQTQKLFSTYEAKTKDLKSSQLGK